MPELIGWVNLHPEHFVVDEDRNIPTISKLARNEHLVIYPSKQEAIRLRDDNQTTYRVKGKIPKGTVYEVVGRIGDTGDSFPYRVGLFAHYEDAHRVASTASINGSRGWVRAVFDYEPVLQSLEEFYADMRKFRYNDQAYYLHSIVEIANEPVGVIVS